MNSSLIIHHSKDLDGFGSACLIIEKLINIDKTHTKQQIKTFPVDANSYNFNNIISSIDNTKDVYILDFCLTLNEMLEIQSKCHNLIFIDHHISSNEISQKLKEYNNTIVVFDCSNERYSACGLVYSYYFNNYPPNYLVDAINYSDILKSTNEFTRSIISFLSIIPWKNYNVLREILFREQLNNIKISKELINIIGKMKVINNEKYIETLIIGNVGTIGEYNGIKCFIINNTNGSINSEMLNKSLYKHNVKLAISYSDILNENKRIFSLRSIDVNSYDIAKLYNGGGHEYAAGFSMSLNDGVKFVNKIINSTNA